MFSNCKTRFPRDIVLGLGLLWMLCFRSAGQDFSSMATNAPRFKAFISKLCPDVPEFSAKTSEQIFDGQSKLRMSLPTNFALRGDNFRQEIDMTAMPQIPPEQRKAMEFLKLDKLTLITRVDRKRVYLVFSGVHAYLEFPLSESFLNDLNVQTTTVDLQKTKIGTETINGHACTKIKVTASEPNKPIEEAILWCAEDLQQLPIKIETVEKDRMVRIEFQDVQIAKPKASMFEVPADYVRLSDSKEILPYAAAKQRDGKSAAPK